MNNKNNTDYTIATKNNKRLEEKFTNTRANSYREKNITNIIDVISLSSDDDDCTMNVIPKNNSSKYKTITLKHNRKSSNITPNTLNLEQMPDEIINISSDDSDLDESSSKKFKLNETNSKIKCLTEVITNENVTNDFNVDEITTTRDTVANDFVNSKEANIQSNQTEVGKVVGGSKEINYPQINDTEIDIAIPNDDIDKEANSTLIKIEDTKSLQVSNSDINYKIHADVNENIFPKATAEIETNDSGTLNCKGLMTGSPLNDVIIPEGLKDVATLNNTTTEIKNDGETENINDVEEINKTNISDVTRFDSVKSPQTEICNVGFEVAKNVQVNICENTKVFKDAENYEEIKNDIDFNYTSINEVPNQTKVITFESDLNSEETKHSLTCDANEIANSKKVENVSDFENIINSGEMNDTSKSDLKTNVEDVIDSQALDFGDITDCEAIHNSLELEDINSQEIKNLLGVDFEDIIKYVEIKNPFINVDFKDSAVTNLFTETKNSEEVNSFQDNKFSENIIDSVKNNNSAEINNSTDTNCKAEIKIYEENHLSKETKLSEVNKISSEIKDSGENIFSEKHVNFHATDDIDAMILDEYLDENFLKPIEIESDDCGYQSSDFEFITEEEARRGGLIDKNGFVTSFDERKHIKGHTKSNKFESNGPGTSTTSENSENSSDDDNDDYVIPGEDELVNMFQNVPVPARREYHVLENKCFFPREPTLFQYEGVGFDMSLVQDSDSEDEQYREEVAATSRTIHEMYPDENADVRKYNRRNTRRR